MRFKTSFIFVLAMLLFQSQSCDNRFHKDPLSEDELWWNEQNEIWQELFLRESGHLGDKINADILNEILSLKRFSGDHYPLGEQGLKPLERLTDLEEVSAGSSHIPNIKSLENLVNLRSISIPDTPVEDLTPLQNLSFLEELYIQQTLVSDLAPLKNANNLQVLAIHQTPISSIRAIMHLENLSILYLGDSSIPKEEIELFRSLHPNCEIN
jgi:hypothetical protein